MFDKKIRDVMTSPVEKLTPEATVKDAAVRMREQDIGTVAICEAGDRPIGIATDRDIAIRCVAVGLDPSKTRISEVMSRVVSTCKEDDSLKDAEKIMEERQIRRLLVVDGSGALRGIVALSDIVGEDTSMTGRIVEKVTQPSPGFAGH